MRLTVCWLPATALELSVTVSVPLLVPVAAGVKVMLIVQLAPAASELPQVLLWENSPAAVMLVRVRGTVPLLVRVKGWAALVAPTN